MQKINGRDIATLIDDQENILLSLENIAKEPEKIAKQIKNTAIDVYGNNIDEMLEMLTLDNFECKDIEEKRIVNFCKKLGCANIKEIKEKAYSKDEEINEAIENFIIDWMDCILVDLGIHFGKYGEVLTNETKLSNIEKNLIYQSSLFARFSICANEATRLLTMYKNEVNKNLFVLDKYNNSLKLLFAKREEKNKINEAYTWFLSKGKGDEYTQQARECINEASSIRNKTVNKIMEEWGYDYDAIYCTLGEIVPEYMHQTNNLYKPYYIELYEAVKESYEKIEFIKNKMTTAENTVIKNVNYAIGQKIKKKLSDIPISDLNNYGAKSKPLEDYGFKKIGEIEDKSKSYFMSLPGIGEKGAEGIVHALETVKDVAAETTKFKISEDNKTKEITDVVKSIIEYWTILGVYQELGVGLSGFNPELGKQIEILEKAASFQRWLKMDSLGKENSEWVSRNIENFLNGGGAVWVENAFSFLNTLQINDEDAWQLFHDNPTNFYKVLEELVPEVLGDSNKKGWLSEKMYNEIQDEKFFPDGLLVELRRYQEIGVKYILHQGCVILADDMGLGKGVQGLASMVSLKNCGYNHFMVICPASVINNWCNEIKNKSRLKCFKAHGQTKKQAIKDWINTGGVVVTNFESLGGIELPSNENFKIGEIIIDEAHYIKNSMSMRTQRTIKICEKADRVVLMTGTALENNVEEMISLIDIIRPDIAVEARRFASFSKSDRFKEIVAPVYFRRKKEDVLTELPDLEEIYESLQMTDKERERYEKAVINTSDNFMKLRRLSLDEDLDYSCKAQRILDIIYEAEMVGRKIIIFSYFIDTINNIRNYLIEKMGKDKCMKPIRGNVSVDERARILKDFEKAPAGTVLLSQINSGGTGLNIQSASVVIICEPQYKPSTEKQAICRAHRMGQTRNVLAYHLVCENTIEELLVERLMVKQRIFNEFADESVAAQRSEEFNDKKFGELIQEEIDRINEKRRDYK